MSYFRCLRAWGVIGNLKKVVIPTAVAGGWVQEFVSPEKDPWRFF